MGGASGIHEEGNRKRLYDAPITRPHEARRIRIPKGDQLACRFAAELDGEDADLIRILTIKTIEKKDDIGAEIRCSIFCMTCGIYYFQTFQMWSKIIREDHYIGEGDPWIGKNLLQEAWYRSISPAYEEDSEMLWHCPICD